MQLAMDSNSPTIGTFQREKGLAFTEGLILAWLAYLNGMLNLNKPMSDDQIELCASEITQDYYFLKFSDLTLLFKNIISGKYGEFYESLSIAKVLSFFREYTEQRFELASSQSQRFHNDTKSFDEFNMSTNTKRLYRGISKHSSK